MHFIKNNHYYKILHGGKYYRLINPRRLFLFTIIPSPADATVTLTATGYAQVGNTISVPAGTQVSWSVSKSGIPTQTGTETITEPKTIYVNIGYPHGTVLFESSTPGTYNINVLYPCTVHVDMVGGGGGGRYKTGASGHTHYYHGGGSGAYITGSININSGGYSIGVAGGGAGGGSSTAAQSGGDSSCFGAIAGGGQRGAGVINDGGTATVGETGLIGYTGNAGNNGGAGGASLYGGYGYGGGASRSGGQNGGNGYVRIYVE